MNWTSNFTGPRRRNVLIAALGVLLVASGSGVGVYLTIRAQTPLQQTAARLVKAGPTPASVGAQALAQPQQAVLLTVVSTKPGDGTSGIATDTPITILFNLAVNPAAAKGMVLVRASDTNISGKFVRGTKPQEVVFKAGTSFANGSSIVITLRSGLKSVDGAALTNDYSFSFTTVPPPNTVTFFNGDQFARLVSAPSGHPITLRIGEFTGAEGESIPFPSSVSIKTYKATGKDLLAALVYSRDKDGYASYLDKAIDIRSMRLVDNGGMTLTASGARVSDVAHADSVTISQPAGIYLVLVTDANGQYGSAWINFSRYGVVLRQDDQKVVMAGEDLVTGDTNPVFNVTFWNLLNGVHSKLMGSFSGTGSFAARYPAGFDIAIATSGGEEVVVPISAPDSGADIRAATDLSKQPQIFLTTDRPAYQKGDTVKFAGVARLSNDQVYTVGGGTKLSLWTSASGTVASATVAPDGTFSGSFRISAAEFSSDGLDAPVTLFANSSSASQYDPNALVSATSFVAVAPNSTTNSFAVSLDKSSYVAGEPLVASIGGFNAARQPLAGQTVSVGVYAAQHGTKPVEMDSFVASPSTWGDRIAAFVKVRLDSAGRATYRMTPQIKAADQEVTVVVVYGSGRAQAFAASTAIFYEADDDVFLLAARSSFQPGEAVVAPFVVENRSGERVGGLQLAYQLERTDYSGDKATTTVVASGTTSTDTRGLGKIRALYSGAPASLVLRIKGKDQAGRVFQDAADLTVGAVGDGSPELDITTDKLAYAVGDSANLIVTSPAAEKVLFSLERGRVHLYKWIQLAKGDNNLSLNITPDLAPGFNVVFTHIRNGGYLTEDMPVYINNSARLLNVTVTPDRPTYAKGQIAHLTITVTDSAGTPVAAKLLADGYEARMSSNLRVDQASIAAAFLTPNRLATNGSSSLVSIGTWGDGMCGGGPTDVTGFASGNYPGRSNLWLSDVTTDSTGRASIDVPMTLPGPVRFVVIANTATSSWGQAETDLSLQ